MANPNLTLALSSIDQLLHFFPTYSQSKRRTLYKLRKEYNYELSKEEDVFDDGRVLSLEFELREWGEIFLAEISGKSV